MTLKLSLFGLAALFFVAATAAPVISYDTLPDRIRNHNPDLGAARFRINEALGLLKQAGRLDNPALRIEAGNNDTFQERSLTLGFSQKFPVTDRLRLEKKISRMDVFTATAEVHDMERQLVAEARKALIDYLALRRRAELLQKQLKVSENFSAEVKTLAAKGEASAIDAGQTRLDAFRFGTELRELTAREKEINGVLKPLLGMELDEPLLVGGDLEKMTLAALPVNLDRRGDVRAAKSEIATAATGVELEQARRHADIEAGIFAGLERTEDAPEGFDNEGIIGFGITIPLPLWDKNEGNIEAAQAKVSRKQAELAALQKNILHRAQAAREEMIGWAAVIREIDATLAAEADEQTELAEATYRQGLTDLLTVLRVREQKFQLQTTRLTALKNFHLARAAYESALGR